MTTLPAPSAGRSAVSTPAAPRARRLPPLGARARFDDVVRVVAGSLLWLSLLRVAYWWVTGGGVQDLTAGWGAGLTSFGRVTGLVASVLLLAQVLLMARVPVLEQAFGQDRLARIHRIVGFVSFDLMVVHVLTITAGYANASPSRLLATTWQLVVDDPGMLLAVAGTACLVMVVVTSVRAARRRLRYESWHLMHLYAYLGVGLALPHQLWMGGDFTGSPGRRVFWWTAWALTAAVVVVFRVLLPAVRTARHSFRVTAVTPEAEGISSIWIAGRRVDRLGAEAGQFLTWRFLTGPGWSRAHPFSLSAAPDPRGLRITVRDLGDGSAAALRVRPGTRVIAEGPYGRLTERARTRRRVALIGAGVGMAPIRALAEGLAYAPGDAVVLQRFTDTPLYAAELRTLAERRGLQVLHLPGRRRHPDSWLGSGVAPGVDDVTALRSWIPDVAERDVYLCGPTAWTDLVRTTLLRAGVPAACIHSETFSW